MDDNLGIDPADDIRVRATRGTVVTYRRNIHTSIEKTCNKALALQLFVEDKVGHGRTGYAILAAASAQLTDSSMSRSSSP